ncbi:hypothetical protein BJ138DRAFT_1015895 [Hygrophoropsis aurantiaca]|uniref:Uncharacterized protein n=1 Tax=Hygrophoropsis aurantiaca TaxID=72124 RepID=A0ACB8A1Z4_9AGAM|nr:hypothetical protein BJ138DRAFT_1015895 [Hygrophoropsis aurantiaca]
MTKIHLKRTPAEEAERAHRKALKAFRKAAKQARRRSPHSETHEFDDTHTHSEEGPSHKRRKPDDYTVDEDVYGPPPPQASSSASKLDYDAIRAEIEEARFREKMWGALEDDERLDAMEARLNDFAHVPQRWQGFKLADSHLKDESSMDPRFMDDDEYAEWIREGMWKKKHAREYEEEVRKKAEKAARRARKKEIKAETARLEQILQETRTEKKREKDRRREQESRDVYDQRWKELQQNSIETEPTLTFEDIPWPVYMAQTSQINSTTMEQHLTADAISAFLIPRSLASAVAREAEIAIPTDDTAIKQRKEKFRETMLRFHPDKFEGRFMRRIVDRDKDRVREAVGHIARALNTLMDI